MYTVHVCKQVHNKCRTNLPSYVATNMYDSLNVLHIHHVYTNLSKGRVWQAYSKITVKVCYLRVSIRGSRIGKIILLYCGHELQWRHRVNNVILWGEVHADAKNCMYVHRFVCTCELQWQGCTLHRWIGREKKQSWANQDIDPLSSTSTWIEL